MSQTPGNITGSSPGNNISRPLTDVVYENTLGNGVQLQGSTNGIAIPSMDIGEVITWSVAPLDMAWPNNTTTDWPNNTITVPAGSWILYAATNSQGSQTGYQTMYIKTGGGATVATYGLYLSGFANSNYTIIKPVDISVSTVYKISMQSATANGNFTGYYIFYAIRR